MAQDWAALQRRLRAEEKPERAPVVSGGSSWRAPALIAAALAIVLGGLYLRALIDLRQLARELREPRLQIAHRLLLPDGQRGEEPPILLSEPAEIFLLRPTLAGKADFLRYRLDFVDLNGPEPKTAWSREGSRPGTDAALEIAIPRELLQPGEYRLELYALTDGAPQRLATYTLRIPAG